MTDDFAPPPAPDGMPAGTVRRADFRPPSPARRRGRFPRWVAALLGLGGLVVAAAVAAQVALTARDANVTPASPDATGRLHSAQVVSGMCLEEVGDTPGPVTVVDCDAYHAAQVVSAYRFTADEWPGPDSVADAVLRFCASQLSAGGPLEHAGAGRSWVAWVPSAGSWRLGDRTGLCIVTADRPWKGSALATSPTA